MKNRITSLACMALTLVLTACPSSSSTSESSVTTSLPPSSVSISSSEQPLVETPIGEIRSLEAGTEVVVTGIVAQHLWSGQATPYKVGFWLVDQTGAIYVYGDNLSNYVEIGNRVSVRGNKFYYIPTTDQGAAVTMNYQGTQQLTTPTLISNDNGNHPIPTEAIIDDVTIAQIRDYPIDTDITGNLYRLKGRVRVVPSSGYTNYYIDDMNRIDTLALYTTSNGKDYMWLDAYDGQVRDMLVAIINAKPQTNLWRLAPVAVYDEYVPSELEEAEYAAKRALSDFGDEYKVDVNFSIPVADPLLEGVTRSYTSTDTDKIAITLQGDEYQVSVITEVLGSLTIEVVASYGEAFAEDSKIVTIAYLPEFGGSTIAEARELPDASEVTLQAIIGRFVYKSGTDVPMGAFVIDPTGSILIYNNAAFMPSLSDAAIGNKIAFTGTLTHYVSNVEVADSLSYTGDFQIMDITLINNDYGQHPIPSEGIASSTIATIAQTPPSNNISGTIFLVEGIIKKVETQYYTTYYVHDAANDEISLNVYSQKQGSEFAWLDDNLDIPVTLYLGVQNLKYSDTSNSWRVAPVSILTAR